MTALFSATGAHLVAASSSLHLVSSLPLIFVDSSSCLIFVTSSSPPPLSGSSLLLSASSSLSLRFYSILGVSPLPARRRSSLQRSGASSSVLLRRILARRRSSGLLSFSGFSLISHQRLFSSARRRSSLQRGGALWGRTIVRPHTHARDGAHLRATALILARRRSSHQRTALQRDDAHLRSSSRHLSFLPPPPSLLVLSSVL